MEIAGHHEQRLTDGKTKTQNGSHGQKRGGEDGRRVDGVTTSHRTGTTTLARATKATEQMENTKGGLHTASG